jgi:hypothetical protein
MVAAEEKRIAERNEKKNAAAEKSEEKSEKTSS